MSVPMEQMEPQMLSDQDEQDIDIVVSKAIELMEDREGPPVEEILAQLLSSPNPQNQMAQVFVDAIEAVMTDPDIVDLEVNPAIWLAEGGAIDELADEFSEIAGEDIGAMMEAIKPEIMKRVAKRAEQFKQGSGMAEAQEPMPAGPPQRAPLLAGGG